jgi:EAL domain-containing protein (putative c-di-GMP-specific phosphodiesterase class I)
VTKHAEMQQMYLTSLTSDLTGWQEPEAKLLKAFVENEFILYSQAISKLGTAGDDRLHVEIYVRLQEEERHLVPPGTFLPVLEHYNMGPRLDRYVARRVLVWYRSLSKTLPYVVHINLCSGTLADPEFPSFVATELKTTGFRGDSLCFEIPDAAMPAGTQAVQNVEKLRGIGCRIAIAMMERDRVSFQPVKDLGAHFVKVGGSLTRAVVTDKNAASKVRALAKACAAFGVQTIAQHVEDQQTLTLLQKLGVDYAQGYGVSMPAPLEVVTQP